MHENKYALIGRGYQFIKHRELVLPTQEGKYELVKNAFWLMHPEYGYLTFEGQGCFNRNKVSIDLLCSRELREFGVIVSQVTQAFAPIQ